MSKQKVYDLDEESPRPWFSVAVPAWALVAAVLAFLVVGFVLGRATGQKATESVGGQGNALPSQKEGTGTTGGKPAGTLSKEEANKLCSPHVDAIIASAHRYEDALAKYKKGITPAEQATIIRTQISKVRAAQAEISKISKQMNNPDLGKTEKWERESRDTERMFQDTEALLAKDGR
jgi:hypothetical protein